MDVLDELLFGECLKLFCRHSLEEVGSFSDRNRDFFFALRQEYLISW